jgi:hypothetical protein
MKKKREQRREEFKEGKGGKKREKQKEKGKRSNGGIGTTHL